MFRIEHDIDYHYKGKLYDFMPQNKFVIEKNT